MTTENTAARPNGPRSEIQFERVEDAIAALDSFLETGARTISLPPHLVISRDGIEGLSSYLRGLPKERIEKLLEKSGVHDHVAYAVATGLIRHGISPHGAKARKAAEHLLTYLKKNPLEKKEQERLEIPENILTFELLEHAKDLTMDLLTEGAITRQLEDPFTLAYVGLVISPVRKREDPAELGFELPRTLLSILETLKFPESGDILESWIYQSLSTDEPEDCIAFLKTLTQFTGLLDSDSYVQLYAGKAGEIPLLPFQSLHKAVVSAKSYLRKIENTDGFVKELDEVEELILLRFHQIIKGPFKDAISATATRALEPSQEDLVLRFVSWAEEMKEMGLSEKGMALHAAKLLEQLGIVEVDRFVRLIEEVGYPSLAKSVKTEAVRLNLLKDQDGKSLSYIMSETLASLEKNPWKDAAICDFARIINPETETLEIYVVTGTFGPFGIGHRDFIDRIRGYIRYKSQIEGDQSRTQRIILIVPITHVATLRGYEKDPAQVGPIYHRVASMLLQLADVNRDEVFITTTLQPRPQTNSTPGLINATVNKFIGKVERDLGNIDVPASFTTKAIVTVGADEMMWEKEVGGGSRLLSEQPKKIRGECLVVGRYGFLIDCIRNSDRIASSTGASLVLTPGTSRTSSTESIGKLRRGDLSSFLAQAIPFVSTYWSSQAINARRRSQVENPDKTPSVQEIRANLIKEYRQILEDMRQH